jgi:hypothetical protein
MPLTWQSWALLARASWWSEPNLSSKSWARPGAWAVPKTSVTLPIKWPKWTLYASTSKAAKCWAISFSYEFLDAPVKKFAKLSSVSSAFLFRRRFNIPVSVRKDDPLTCSQAIFFTTEKYVKSFQHLAALGYNQDCRP